MKKREETTLKTHVFRRFVFLVKNAEKTPGKHTKNQLKTHMMCKGIL